MRHIQTYVKTRSLHLLICRLIYLSRIDTECQRQLYVNHIASLNSEKCKGRDILIN